MTRLKFPDHFLWGVAASAYQIEGAWNEDGRGLSIWDTFSHTPGKTWQGETGDVAADHYHRYPEDVALMKELGFPAYRFSVAWPRILPDGAGGINPKGLDFYERLVDTLLANNIEPWAALHHYDLPQALQDKGGWPNRDTAYHFAEYARVVTERLSDRVTHWIPHNEPLVVAMLGYFTGEHAPGEQNPVAALQAAHHLLLSHGLATQAIRAAAKQPVQVGAVINLSPVYPASDSDEDRQAAARFDAFSNRMYLDPLLRGEYPAEIFNLLGPFFPQPQPDDLRHISSPLDFLGVNYYTRAVVKHDSSFPFIEAALTQPVGNDYSQMWEIYPEGMYDLLMRVWQDYGHPKMYVTENGVCVPDGVDHDGRVRDERRVRYLRDHLAQVNRALADGAPVKGYFVWSPLDNFEWALGYKMRFGLIYVDYATQKRIVKDSGRWYANVIRHNSLEVKGE